MQLVSGEMDPAVADYERVVRDGFRVALERRGYEVIPADQEVDPGAYDLDTLLLQYEYTLIGFLPRLHVTVAVRDLQAGTRVTGALAVARGNITLYTSLDEILETIEPRIEGYRVRRADSIRNPWPVTPAGEIVFPASAGEGGLTVMDRVTGAPIGEDLFVSEGAELPLRFSREGYYSRDVNVSVSGPRTEVPDPDLRRQGRFGAQLQYSYPRLIGGSVGGRYYPLPDLLYVGMELGLHMSGLPGRTPSRLTHLDPRLMVGYLPRGTEDEAVQPWFSSGLGLVTTFPSYADGDTGPYTDWYWNVLNVGVELGRRMVRLYGRLGVSYYFDTDRSLWEPGINPDLLWMEAALGTVLRW
ncbi:MAG: hypothetical protein EA427_05350 [Spirochaetaceae bacterium]|nr:MAG: hypothetical protein EA427_05350 [Spirochaetaceae bacterium]